MIVGFQHLAVALADRHAAVGAFGVFRQLKERVPVLIELQADLAEEFCQLVGGPDRKSTRLNSSHVRISYAVFCLKKKKRQHKTQTVHPTLSHCSHEPDRLR